MLPRKALIHFLLLLAMLCVSGAEAVRAQAFDLAKDRLPIAELDGLWRFHPGDDPHWADPAFDDSSWPLLRSDRGWSSQGYPKMSGFGWYRFRVKIPAGSAPLALYFPRFLTSYEVYADGRLLGGFGGMPPRRNLQTGRPPVYRLPATAQSQASTILIAIRVWHWPYWAHYYGGGPQSAGYIGGAAAIDRMRVADFPGDPWSWAPPLFSALLCFLGAIFALGFAWQHRREREYLWFGVWLLFKTYIEALACAGNFGTINIDFREISRAAAEGAGTLAFLAFYIHLLHGRKNWLFWVSAFVSLTRPLPFLLAMMGIFTQTQVSACNFSTLVPPIIWVLILVTVKAFEGVPDARLLLGPTLLVEGVNLAGIVTFEMFALGLTHGSMSATRFFNLSARPFIDVIFLSAMLAILVGRFTRTRRHEEHLAGELQAARIVQQILIPEQAPRIPGFAIQSCYIPAGEVGGDFFQILPANNGGVLAVIGDVSGKGLPAAMTVSLLVGTVRTLVQYTQSPGEILAAMNGCVLGRSGGGFTTCLALRVDADGTLTVANAGHLAPYLDGRELATDNGLPLGLSAESKYPELTVTLHADQRLTLLTDGVVEARDASGELMGFERACALSTEAAERIAEAARRFGQEDDITVLTLDLQPVAVPA
ncbi:SpoIIE family protein phosphatase [Occallatibacter savannae]|uniref:SpoIIE family protein phosphatase n=1 Tax=Occallatibacter savannae TaxID=1002691 RepID=UPI000D6A01E9|nr:SpoIIE family protein phosphatase [Occallatibacter savannae]